MMPMIISCRVSTPEATEFRSKLGFKQHDIALSEGCRIDLYFLKQKLAIEVDEKGHIDRGKRKKKNERQERIKKELGCNFIRISPNKKDYHEFFKFGEINNDIIESNKKSTKKSTKKSLQDNLSTRK